VSLSPRDTAADVNLLNAAMGESFPQLKAKAESIDVGSVARTTAVDFAELLFWMNEANRYLSRLPTATDAAIRLQEADSYLMLAATWAREAEAWDEWAKYQCALGNAKRSARDFPAAAAACESVLALEQDAVAFATRLDALLLLRDCSEQLKRPWKEAEWGRAFSYFPTNEPSAALPLIRLRIERLASQDAWKPADVEAISQSIRSLNDARAAEVNEILFLWNEKQALHAQSLAATALTAASESKDQAQGFNSYRIYVGKLKEAASYASAAIAAASLQFSKNEADGKNDLDRLVDDIRPWSRPGGLPRWQKERLIKHFRKAHRARLVLASAVAAMIDVRGFLNRENPIGDRPDVNALQKAVDDELKVALEPARHAAKLLQRELVSSYFDAKQLPAWDSEFSPIEEYLFGR
jgi:hypothetical protein